MRRLPGIATLPKDRETPDLRCEKPAPPPASPFMTVHSNTFLVFGCAQIVALVEACATPLLAAAAPSCVRCPRHVQRPRVKAVQIWYNEQAWRG